MKKKIISLILALAMVLPLVPVFEVPLLSTPAEAVTEVGYNYTISGGMVTITGVKTSVSGEVTIPSVLNGLPVFAIDVAAFQGCTDLTSITIPDSVTFIAADVFSGCSSLASVSIGKGVTSIGERAFANCPSLTSLTVSDENPVYYSANNCIIRTNSEILCLGCKTSVIPYGVITIDSYAFYSCEGLTSIVIPNSVFSIDNYSFYGCTGLTSVVIPDRVTSIGNYVFYGCSSLASVTIGKGVTSIGNYAFQNCGSLAEVWYVGAETDRQKISIGNNNDALTSAAWHYVDGACDSTCNTCGATRSIPHAYYGDFDTDCDICGEVRFVSGTTGDCTWTSNGTELTIFGNGAMGNYEEDPSNFYLPNTPWGFELIKVIVEDGITNIGDYAFSDCQLRSVGIGRNVISIGKGAFFMCKFESIELPNSVTTIGGYAFGACNALSEVWYVGTQEGRQKLSIASGNDDLTAATWHYIDGHCDATCNVCGATRSAPGHTYDNACDTTCNGCGEVRTVAGHVYDNACDASCNNCGATRSITHAYYGDFDTTCNVCGEARVVSGTTGDCTWTLDGTVLTISGNGKMGDYELGDDIWASNTPWGREITQVIIEDGVTNIGKAAFVGCNELSSVNIGKDVTSIGDAAFQCCGELLRSIDLPKSVKNIGSWAFAWCYLESIEIPEGVTEINEYTFVWTSLSSVKIPNTVKTIGKCAFMYAFLESVEIPNSVITIGDDAFSRTDLKSVTIPDSVTSIGNYAFYGIEELTAVTIGKGVTSVGEAAFACCDSLTSITIPGNVKYVGKWAFEGCEQLSSVIIGKGVTSIGQAAFHGCVQLKSITIPGNVKYVGKWVFQDCGQLTTVTFESGVETIDYGAFMFCSSLSSITIPDSVTTLGEYVFQDCTSLQSAVLGEGITEVSRGLFFRCSALSSVETSDKVTAIGPSAFFKCSALESIGLPSGLQTIGDYAFELCTVLADIKIPNTVTSIGNEAFYGCESLKKITVPAGTTSIGEYAFNGCSVLTSLSVEKGNSVYHSAGNCIIETESKTLVAGCKESVIPDDGTVTAIGNSAFYDCTALTSITIPSSVTVIGDEAFDYCSGLTNVWYIGTQEDQQNISIGVDNEALTSATWHYIDGYCDATCNVCDATREASAHEFGAPSAVENELQYTCIDCGHVKTEEKNLLSSTDSVTATDGKTTLQVPEGSEALIHKETQLLVEALSEEENAQIVEKAKDDLALAFGENQQIACTFDVKILLDNEVIQPGGEVKITLEIPETAKNYMNLTVVYIDDDGKVTPCQSTLNPDGTISFLAEHFSNYSLVGELITYTPGDLDGVEGVTLDDAIYLLYYVNFPEKYPVNQTADFDSSGDTDLDDAIYLLYHVNFPSKYPLH